MPFSCLFHLINCFERTVNNFKLPIFIYGNENTGIPKNIMDTYRKFENAFILELHQMGALQSYNVSNSCAIVSYLVSLYFNDIPYTLFQYTINCLTD